MIVFKLHFSLCVCFAVCIVTVKVTVGLHWDCLLKGCYTFSIKLSDFTVWHHTWQKNWINCAVLTGNSAGLRTVLSSHLSHRELRGSLGESHIFLILPADTTMASSQGTQPSKMNKREATLGLYSFSNTTSYSTFYAFFSSFWIALWPIWLANSKWQPCFYPS